MNGSSILEGDELRSVQQEVKDNPSGIEIQVAKCYTRTRGTDREENLLHRLHILHGHLAYDTIARQYGISSAIANNMPPCSSCIMGRCPTVQVIKLNTENFS